MASPLDEVDLDEVDFKNQVMDAHCVCFFKATFMLHMLTANSKLCLKPSPMQSAWYIISDSFHWAKENQLLLVRRLEKLPLLDAIHGRRDTQ